MLDTKSVVPASMVVASSDAKHISHLCPSLRHYGWCNGHGQEIFSFHIFPTFPGIMLQSAHTIAGRRFSLQFTAASYILEVEHIQDFLMGWDGMGRGLFREGEEGGTEVWVRKRCDM